MLTNFYSNFFRHCQDLFSHFSAQVEMFEIEKWLFALLQRLGPSYKETVVLTFSQQCRLLTLLLYRQLLPMFGKFSDWAILLRLSNYWL